jgi:hypothetical protein
VPARDAWAESKPWDLIRIMPAWESEPPFSSAHSPIRSSLHLGRRMELYLVIYYMLVWSIVIAVLGIVAFPWGMVAYKIWYGNKPIEEDMRDELFWRSLWAGWPLALSAVIFVVIDHVTVVWLDLPAGPIHLVFFLGFLAWAAAIMMYCFSLEDWFQGLILAVIYLYIPAGLLIFVRRWNPLYDYVLKWLTEPTG